MTRAREDPVSTHKFRLSAIDPAAEPVTAFNRMAMPIVFKCTPDTLLNLCLQVADAMPLPVAKTWTIEDVCEWLQKCGYSQYQNTFRKNFITGRSLPELDASALSALNIKDFEHIKDITSRIRSLFYFEMTEFGRCLTLHPFNPNHFYTLFRAKTGAKYEVRRSDLWRKMRVIRHNEVGTSHWNILEHYLGKEKKLKEVFGARNQTNNDRGSGGWESTLEKTVRLTIGV